MPPEETRYDVIGGVSIGAYNAAIFATYEIGDEKAAAEKVYSLWDGISTSEFLDYYSPRILAPFQHTSLLSNKPMEDTLAEILGDKPFIRDLSILSVDINKGQVIVFDETMSLEDRIQGVMASGSV